MHVRQTLRPLSEVSSQFVLRSVGEAVRRVVRRVSSLGHPASLLSVCRAGSFQMPHGQ